MKTPGWLRVLWKLLLGAAIVWYAIWRWMILTGSIHKVGGSCHSVVQCVDGPCLVHARNGAGGIEVVPGYCSHQCKSDRDCPTGLHCEARPPEISGKNGDHLPLKVPERLCIKGPPAAAPAKSP